MADNGGLWYMPWIGGERKLNLSGGIDAVTMWGVPAALELEVPPLNLRGMGPVLLLIL